MLRPVTARWRIPVGAVEALGPADDDLEGVRHRNAESFMRAPTGA
jgi:hypothetical protein